MVVVAIGEVYVALLVGGDTDDTGDLGAGGRAVIAGEAGEAFAGSGGDDAGGRRDFAEACVSYDDL